MQKQPTKQAGRKNPKKHKWKSLPKPGAHAMFHQGLCPASPIIAVLPGQTGKIGPHEIG